MKAIVASGENYWQGAETGPTRMVYFELICPHCGRISPFSPMDELWEQWCIRCGNRLQDPPEAADAPAAEAVAVEAPAAKQRIAPMRPNPDRVKPLAAALSSWAAATATAEAGPDQEAGAEQQPVRMERRMGADGVSRETAIQQIPEPGEIKAAGPSSSHGWLMGSALIVLGMAGSAYLGFHLASLKPATQATAVAPSRSAEELPALAARRMAERFLTAGTPEELLACIREPSIWEPAVRRWCQENPKRLPLGGSITAQQFPRTVLGRRILENHVEFADRTRSLLLSVESPGGWLVDWASFCGTGDMTIEDFLARRPNQPVLLLVMAQRFGYYNGAYADSAALQCLRLTNERATGFFYGYLRRNGDGAPVLPPSTPVFDPAKPPPQPRQPLAVLARFAEGAGGEPPQAEITAISGEGWFVP